MERPDKANNASVTTKETVGELQSKCTLDLLVITLAMHQGLDQESRHWRRVSFSCIQIKFLRRNTRNSEKTYDSLKFLKEILSYNNPVYLNYLKFLAI